MRVVAYYRVSTDKQGESGLGLLAQRADVLRWCELHGHELVLEESDIQSGKSMRNRPGLTRAIHAVTKPKRRGTRLAEVLVVAKLDRVSRSTIDTMTIIERAKIGGWQFAALDIGLDMTTPMGEAFAGMLAVLAQWERRMIGERTRKAMAAKQALGEVIGRPRAVPEEFRARLHAMHDEGLTDAEIARELNGQGIPSLRGVPDWRYKDVWSLRRRPALVAP